ncbi:MAG: alpha/beta hydrolase [Verrucomicrobiales bacterium]|nr:alpha/beta hydrolase [Verrucomicrobiales bacterium]
MASISAQQKGKAPGGPPTKIPQEVLDGLEEQKDIVYTSHGDRKLELDLYRPKNQEGKLPVIVCIHGGGWWQGNRASHAKIAQHLAGKGYVAVTISYRLSGEKPFPAAIHDCKAAVRFLRSQADKYGIDPEKIGAIGLSAGGHLAAILATSAGVDELEGVGSIPEISSAIQAAVPMGAQADTNAAHIQAIRHTPANSKPGGKPNPWIKFLGGTPAEVPENYKAASPLTYLDKGDAPCHFIAGKLDNDGTRAKTFRAQSAELGIPSGLTTIPDAPHAFVGRQQFFDQAMKQAVNWFDEHLKGKK